MFTKNCSSAQDRSIKQEINQLVLIMALGMAVIFIVLLVTFLSINSRYEGALLCATTAADYNKGFKENIDREIYNSVIQPRDGHSEYDLSLAELDQAETLFRRLESTTSLADNRWRAHSMIGICQNLRMYIEEIADTDSYDRRMELLDRNIRGETGLTRLIEQYMHDFIDDEVRELSRLHGQISRQSTALTLITVIATLILFLVFLLYSMRVSRHIASPITALTEKAAKYGTEDYYQVPPIVTDMTELQILNRTLNRMADHIDELMQKQIENERSLHRAELELLQAQINPHFLYNTLDSIAILAENHREEDVVHMVTSLSVFFRNSLSGGEDIIPLSAELAQASSYLAIQHVRYSDILTYSIDVDEDIGACLVPKLILQPLIENGLYHGIKNRRGRGVIAITGSRTEDGIVLKVRDNGAGMDSAQLARLQSGDYQDNHSGLGLKNVQQRIHLYCGDPYGLSFESEIGHGTTVSILLPANGISPAQKEALKTGRALS